MNIRRILKAVQRTSHLSNKQMVTNFPELFELQWREDLENIRWQTLTRTRSVVAEMRGLACPVKNSLL